MKLAMQVVGDPTLCAKSVIELRGVSGLLAGKYYVTDVKHAISGAGYVCDLKMTRDGAGRIARRSTREQGGKKNMHKPAKKEELVLVEVVDPETGETRIEYRSSS